VGPSGQPACLQRCGPAARLTVWDVCERPNEVWPWDGCWQGTQRSGDPSSESSRLPACRKGRLLSALEGGLVTYHPDSVDT